MKISRLAILAALPFLCSCSTIANYLEDQLECDEEVKCEFKVKVDFEDEEDKL